MLRTNLTDAARRAQMSISRASVRDFDDNHLMQQIKEADVFHSETPSDFERWQMVGVTAVPLKQDEEEKKQKQDKKSSSGNGGGEHANTQDSEWNHDQPTGPSAEALMVYPGGVRAHPIGMVDDRRVRPYKMKAGESALYSADGSGQMLLHKADGAYLVTRNGKAYGKDAKEQDRFVSIRHIEKPYQTREIKEKKEGEKQQEEEDFKHEGVVNTEIKVEKNKITFRVVKGSSYSSPAKEGTEVVKTVYTDEGKIERTISAEHKINAPVIILNGTTETKIQIGSNVMVHVVGNKVYLGGSSSDSMALVLTVDGPSKNVYAKT